jgi:hypothetical protein
MKKLFITFVALFFLSLSGFSTNIPRVYEEEIITESWMTVPFTKSYLTVESWMLNIFVSDLNRRIPLKGVSKTGEYYKITLTEETYNYNGIIHDIYVVEYENDSLNVGVGKDSFILFTDELIIFYKYSYSNFGIYRIFFNSEEAQQSIDHNEYRRQTSLLSEKKNIEETIIAIVENFPLLKKTHVR